MTGYLKLSDFSIRGIEQIKSEIILQITNYINENDLGSGSVSVDDIVDALTITVNDDGKAQVNLPINTSDVQGLDDLIIAINDSIANVQGRVDVIENALDNATSGQDGLSAYEIAVNNGFTESESDWLLSLNGTDGISGIDGIDGKSAYEVALDNGFIGSESEWLETLKGQKGDKGERGDGWNIVKTYGSVVEMDADFSNVTVEDGDLVSISTNSDEEDNAKVFMKGSTAFHFVVDLSGAQGIKGENGAIGERGESGFSAYQLAINNGFVGTVTEWLEFLKGEKGDTGAMQDLTVVEQSIQNVQQQVTAYDEEINDIRNKLALSKITSGNLVGNNAITVTLPEGGTYLVVTQVQITDAIANLELVSATGAIYSITKLSPNAESILTYSGMNLFLKNEDNYYISYFIYRLL